MVFPGSAGPALLQLLGVGTWAGVVLLAMRGQDPGLHTAHNHSDQCLQAHTTASELVYAGVACVLLSNAQVKADYASVADFVKITVLERTSRVNGGKSVLSLTCSNQW